MDRHDFIVCSDIRLLEVDARLAVSDEAGNNSSDWLAGHPDQRSDEARLQGPSAGQVAKVAQDPDVCAAGVPPAGVSNPQSSGDLCTRFSERVRTHLVRRFTSLHLSLLPECAAHTRRPSVEPGLAYVVAPRRPVEVR